MCRFWILLRSIDDAKIEDSRLLSLVLYLALQLSLVSGQIAPADLCWKTHIMCQSLPLSTLDGFSCCSLHCVPCRNILPNNRFVFLLSQCIIFVQNEVFLSLVVTVSSGLPGWRLPQIRANPSYLQLANRQSKSKFMLQLCRSGQ